MEHWGYARVSTSREKQAAGFDNQLAELKRYKCTQTFQEEASAGGDRPVFDTMIDQAIDRAESIADAVYIHVTKMDRAFRDLEQALSTVKRTPKYNVYWVLHDISSYPIDPKDPAQSLLVSVLGAIGQFEKDRFAERRAVGIAKAKADGKYKGRKPTARAKTEDVLAWKAKGLKAPEIATMTGMGVASVYRILKAQETKMAYTLIYTKQNKETGREQFASFDLAKEMASKAVDSDVADSAEVLDQGGVVQFRRPRLLRASGN